MGQPGEAAISPLPEQNFIIHSERQITSVALTKPLGSLEKIARDWSFCRSLFRSWIFTRGCLDDKNCLTAMPTLVV
jgi:hypothetical protein